MPPEAAAGRVALGVRQPVDLVVLGPPGQGLTC
jgi:hypothetical protein